MTMSNESTPRSPADLRQVIAEEARYGANEIRRSWKRIALLFAVILLPLWGFGELADEVREGEAFFFDKPVLEWMRAMHAPAPDRFFLIASKLGYEWGVVPFDVLLVVVLAAMRRYREGLFAGLSLAGSGLLNLAAKQYFGRERPPLWESLAPEGTYSFPSGHAMGSMTLAAVLVLLAWPTRWRWPVLLLMLAFVIAVGASRVYLGVHYPSDILAGWAAALTWVFGIYLLLFRRAYRPWQDRRPGR